MLKRIHISSLLRTKNSAGDTIVEVLIAIAIAAFAIGTSYAIANRSLQQAVTSRERNEAINLVQNQIAALKLRYHTDQKAFIGTDPTYDNPTIGFAVKSTTGTPPASALPYSDFHFCLDELSGNSSDNNHQWSRIDQPAGFTDTAADNISSSNNYNPGNGGTNPGCIRNVSGTDYFIDISAQITSTSINTVPRTVYKVAVRWAQTGNAANGQAVVYYRF